MPAQAIHSLPVHSRPHRLFTAHQRLIPFTMSHHFSRILSDPERRDDAFSAAAMGLWDACTRFDPARKVGFAHYGVTVIRGYVLRHLLIERRQARLGAFSLDAPQSEGEDDGVAWHERIEDVNAERPGAAVVSGAGFEAMLEGLPERHQAVLRAVYGRGETLGEVGASMGVSKQRAGQLHDAAIAALRKRQKLS